MSLRFFYGLLSFSLSIVVFPGLAVLISFILFGCFVRGVYLFGSSGAVSVFVLFWEVSPVWGRCLPPGSLVSWFGFLVLLCKSNGTSKQDLSCGFLFSMMVWTIRPTLLTKLSSTRHEAGGAR